MDKSITSRAITHTEDTYEPSRRSGYGPLINREGVSQYQDSEELSVNSLMQSYPILRPKHKSRGSRGHGHAHQLIIVKTVIIIPSAQPPASASPKSKPPAKGGKYELPTTKAGDQGARTVGLSRTIGAPTPIPRLPAE